MTQKLTAAKARERIEHLQNWQAQRGLTLREEEYLQALELALLVLEAKPVAELRIYDVERAGYAANATLAPGYHAVGKLNVYSLEKAE